MNRSTKLNPYMVFDRAGGPQEGAILVFAHNSREAKKIGWKWVDCFFITEYIYAGVRRLREYEDYLYSLADQEKLEKGIPHVIDNPPSCRECRMWGVPLDENGICEWCRGDN